MTAIQAVSIRSHEERTSPKPHVVFRMDIQAHVRSWSMWRRYSEFADLHAELTKSTGAPPPAPLPPKHALQLLRSRTNPALLEERRAGLEAYLRSIVGSKDPRWRDNYAFRDFLGVPAGPRADAPAAGAPLSASAWLDEHRELQARVRDMRAALNRRDALADHGDVGGAHSANAQARKTLAGTLARVGELAAALDALARGGMGQGELQRRTDMVGRLQDDCEKIGRMVTVARITSRGLGSAAERNPSTTSDRAALIGKGGGGGGTRVTRTFGQRPAAQETAQTRPLDDQGLLQLQQTQMDQQDAQLAQLTAILQRQKQLGAAIGNELALHQELLDDLDNEVDRFGNKLGAAKKDLNRLG
ncbi:Phox homologous domain-containing protein [Vararia minispora EC-137]|uniref:Phox homologous domain-containing protein n=1 Tax=Vararia minispora EC-137 TaxID=1314806 RepID=A0ACB8QGE4_9AGAM|nr:Phox homologous domain-containing protein [Vararia minispora EC-137]